MLVPLRSTSKTYAKNLRPKSPVLLPKEALYICYVEGATRLRQD